MLACELKDGIESYLKDFCKDNLCTITAIDIGIEVIETSVGADIMSVDSIEIKYK